MTDAIEAQVERFAPGFRQRVLARHVLSPADLERRNANLVGGDIGGGAMNLRQLFSVRRGGVPDAAAAVFICSASTPPGARCTECAGTTRLRRRWVDETLWRGIGDFGRVMGGRGSEVVEAFPGKTPVLDGVISPGEWEDATRFTGVEGWRPQFLPVQDGSDLSLRGYVKHDGKRLYFAFDVTDDVLYGIDTPRWLPGNNPKAHELTREGFPWFGDEIEVLINASNHWVGNEDSAGNGSSWQMVCNLTKSRKGGVGTGGLLEGEPRRDARAWETYQGWIQSGAQECAARPKPGGKGYVIEWAVNFDPVPGSVARGCSMRRRWETGRWV